MTLQGFSGSDTSCVGSSLVWNFERKLLETRWSQKSKQDKFHRIIQFDKKMDDNIHPLTTMFLISSQTGWIKTQSWQKTVEMKRKGASLQHWRVAKFVLGRLLETRSQGALHSPTFGGHQSTVARAEVNISPKYLYFFTDPKMARDSRNPLLLLVSNISARTPKKSFFYAQLNKKLAKICNVSHNTLVLYPDCVPDQYFCTKHPDLNITAREEKQDRNLSNDALVWTAVFIDWLKWFEFVS